MRLSISPRRGWQLLSAVPIAATLAFTLAWGVDLPRVDEWNLIPSLGRAHDGTLTFFDLWYPANVHFGLFPRLVFMGLSRATGWNLRIQMLCTLVFTCGTLLLLRRILERMAGVSAWSLPVASCFLFSWHAHDNWLWAHQINIAMSVFGVVGALAFLADETLLWRSLVASLLFAVVASWSFLNGFLVWPIGGILLALRHRESLPWKSRALTVWIAAAIVTALIPAAYLILTANPKWGGSPWLILDFATRYFGAGLLGPMADAPALRIAGGIGQAAILGIATWAVVKRRAAPAMLALVAVGLFGLTSGYMIALGRASISGIAGAAASRYTTFSALSWIVIVVIPGIGILPARRWARAAHAAVALSAVAILLGTAAPDLEAGRESARRRTEAAAALKKGEGVTSGVLEEALGGIPPGSILSDSLATLRRHRLSLFRNASPEELSPPPWKGPLQGRMEIASANGRSGRVEVQGGIPGNVAYAVIDRPSGPFLVGPMTLGQAGEGELPFEVEPGTIPAGATFHIFSLDRTGTTVRSPPGTVQR